MKKVYDKTQKRLICYKENSDSNFWDEHWRDFDILNIYRSLSKYNLVRRVTQRYSSPENGPILEGGCGLGQYVYSLSQAGYQCMGVDSAEKTITKINSSCPEIDVSVMDIRSLAFPDNYFAGYWSLGVIEHFLEGYDCILNEMHRVIKPGGYVFVTLPVISLLRRIKIFWGLYPVTNINNIRATEFYQFILSYKKIIDDFEEKGFKLVKTYNWEGNKGLRDEVKVLRMPLQYITQFRNRNIIFKIFIRILDIFVSPLAGHGCLFVFKKRNAGD